MKTLRSQAEAQRQRNPDVIALQEITSSTAAVFRDAVPDMGLYHVQTSLELVEDHPADPHCRHAGLLIASRWPFRVLSPQEFNIPWPNRVLSVALDTPWGEVEAHTAYLPVKPDIQARTFEGIFDRLARPAKLRRILCGDLNAPREETDDGQVVPWLRKDRGATEELSVLRGLAEYDLADVYRSLHGYARKDFSWYSGRGDRRFGFRLDHVLASRSLRPIECGYLHAFRERGLSDHSALEVRFGPTSPTAVEIDRTP